MPAGPLTIFHVTDVHGRIERQPFESPLDRHADLLKPGSRMSCHAGLAAIEPILVQQAKLRRGDGHQLMFVSCGDLLGIEMIHDWVDRGRSTLEALEALVDAAGIDTCIHLLGNHSVDCGVDALLELRRLPTRFQFISGNVSIDGKRMSRVVQQPISVGEWHLGILNLTTTVIHSDAPVADRSRIRATEPLRAARAALARVDMSKLDARLGVVHLSDDQDTQIIALDQLDALMGGHSHALHGRRIGAGGWYAKAGCYGRVLGVLTLVPHTDGARVAEDQTWLVPAFDPPQPDSRVMQSFHANNAALRSRNPALYAPIARLPQPVGSVDDIRRREVPLGRLVAEVLRVEGSKLGAKVDIAFINAGNIRADLVGDANAVGHVHLRAVVPYDNRIVLLELGLAELRQLLATSVASARADPAGHLQWSGLEVEIGDGGELGDVRLTSTGVRMDEKQVVRVATIDYLARGRHHCEFLRSHVVEDDGPLLVEAWVESLRACPDATVWEPTTACVIISEELTNLDHDRFIAAVARIDSHPLAWLRKALS